MKVDLDRKDLISLLKGTKPHFSVMEKIPKKLGSYMGGFIDEWRWNRIDENVPYSDQYLFDLYLLCKESWN